MTCYIAVWKINVMHNIIVWMCYITCYIWFKSGAPPPLMHVTCARICSKLKAKHVLFIYSSSGRPSASTPFKHPPRQWSSPSMVPLGCLCHNLLKMNAQDEQPWREILLQSSKDTTCNNKIKGVGSLSLSMVSSKIIREGGREGGREVG